MKEDVFYSDTLLQHARYKFSFPCAGKRKSVRPIELTIKRLAHEKLLFVPILKATFGQVKNISSVNIFITISESINLIIKKENLKRDLRDKKKKKVPD